MKLGLGYADRHGGKTRLDADLREVSAKLVTRLFAAPLTPEEAGAVRVAVREEIGREEKRRADDAAKKAEETVKRREHAAAREGR